MTAEQFRKRGWTSTEQIVHAHIIYTICSIDFLNCRLTISDGVRKPIEVSCTEIELHKKRQ